VALLLMVGTGQALADHVECGEVVTRDTTLDSDLIDCPANGIVIGADDITLDLNGTKGGTETSRGGASGPAALPAR
jgi:hypothetical protein